jgi:hypothetical protein
VDVVAWLRGLGLEQYAPGFRDNDVDGEVLPELTAEDLIGLGMNSAWPGANSSIGIISSYVEVAPAVVGFAGMRPSLRMQCTIK